MFLALVMCVSPTPVLVVIPGRFLKPLPPFALLLPLRFYLLFSVFLYHLVFAFSFCFFPNFFSLGAAFVFIFCAAPPPQEWPANVKRAPILGRPNLTVLPPSPTFLGGGSSSYVSYPPLTCFHSFAAKIHFLMDQPRVHCFPHPSRVIPIFDPRGWYFVL